MAFVEGNGVSSHETAHDFAERRRARPASRGISRGGRAGSQKKMYGLVSRPRRSIEFVFLLG